MLAWQACRRAWWKTSRHHCISSPLSSTASPVLSRQCLLRPVGGLPFLTQKQMLSMSFEDAIATLNGHLEAPRQRPKQPLGNDDKQRARRARFQLLSEFIEALELKEPLSHLKVIHVAGTKGKGSTCAFAESILRSCGYRTGLFTSPHLVDIRERFRFNGDLVSEDIFAKHFWWCWSRVQALERESATRPFFFPFLTFLALKMFTEEKVDVAILEVGLGGRYDATNVVQNPVVCGITSLGFDHMDVLGNTLGEIAFEKAGIFKAGVPAFSVIQEPEAMKVLHEEAKLLSVPFGTAPTLGSYLTQAIHLGLDGEHQRLNAALAVSLCSTFEDKTQTPPHLSMLKQGKLPEAYLHGLATTCWPGRGQVIRNVAFQRFDGGKKLSEPKSGSLTFYLDGAHTPESLDVCASWYFSAVTRRTAIDISSSSSRKSLVHGNGYKHLPGNNVASSSECQRILLFNCMPKRDPHLLLQSFLRKCEKNGTHINLAIFVPQFSSTLSIETRSVSDIYLNAIKNEPDLSWQKVLQQTWESLQKEYCEGLNVQLSVPHSLEKLNDVDKSKTGLPNGVDNGKRGLPFGMESQKLGSEYEKCIMGSSSVIMPSLTAALNLLDSWSTEYPVELEVLVTGSLYLVGDVLKICKACLTDPDVPVSLRTSNGISVSSNGLSA